MAIINEITFFGKTLGKFWHNLPDFDRGLTDTKWVEVNPDEYFITYRVYGEEFNGKFSSLEYAAKAINERLLKKEHIRGCSFNEIVKLLPELDWSKCCVKLENCCFSFLEYPDDWYSDNEFLPEWFIVSCDNDEGITLLLKEILVEVQDQCDKGRINQRFKVLCWNKEEKEFNRESATDFDIHFVPYILCPEQGTKMKNLTLLEANSLYIHLLEKSQKLDLNCPVRQSILKDCAKLREIFSINSDSDIIDVREYKLLR